ncbi:MAG: exodeoxyribonuclease VII small subunit [Clostridia bacterium]|nr:exodeoxyribonuclease VII small subunit [Clostridia bacterium]
MAKKKLSFEEAMLRLREITELLERGNVSLEESVKLFSEGTELSALCYETLQKAEQKITELSEIGGEEA